MPAIGMTNSMRLLEARKIPYHAHRYPENLRSATDVAAAIGAPPDQVYKTLVVVRERGKPLLVMVPGEQELDLRILATELGEKKLRMASQHQAEQLTGLQVGGISALCLVNKGFDVYADESIACKSKVYVSAGSRGLNLSMKPDDLLTVTLARLVKTRPE